MAQVIGSPAEADGDQGAEAAGTPPQQDGKKEVVSASAGLLKRTLSTVLNALSFTMGMAWLSFTKVLLVEDCCTNPGQDEAPETWLCFLVAAVILVPVSVLLMMRRLQLAKRAEEAAARRDWDAAKPLHVTALAYQTVLSWGVAFTLAGQLALATSATLPDGSWGWRAFYVAVLLVFVVLFAYLVFRIGMAAFGLSSQLLESLADILVSSAAYTIALGFLDAVSAAFSLSDVTTSTDLIFLAAFTVAMFVVTATALVVLACFDRSDATTATQEVKQGMEANDQGVVIAKGTRPTRFIGTNIRKLLAKMLSMCGVVAAYALFYTSLSTLDTFGRSGDNASAPLTFSGAMVFFLATLLASIIGSIFIECLVDSWGKRLKGLDPLPGKLYDDWVIMALLNIMHTSSGTSLEALAWLVGTALHGFSMVAYTEVLNVDSDATEKATVAFGFAAFFTLLAPLVTLWVAPPPLQGGPVKSRQGSEYSSSDASTEPN